MGGPVRAVRRAAEEPPQKAPADEHHPYIPAAQVLPELTVKVFVVGILLSWIMAAANAYLGLFAALTVSAAIPASVVSMAVLRFFKRRNILENNLIQTTASAGESVTAGIIFTLPALLFLGVWQEIGVFETIVIAALGGSLGVLFTIPLRRAFIVEAKLQYPEGVATVEVLKSGEKGGAGIGYIVLAGALGAGYKLMSGGLGLWREAADFARRLGSSGFYLGGTLSPALIAVGFIVGLPIAVLIFLGGFIAYGVAIPTYLATHAWPTDAAGADLDAVAAFATIRSAYVRYIGVGAMATGGVWTLFRLRSALRRGFDSGLEAYRAMKQRGEDTRVRTERDINMRTVLITMVAFVVPLTVLFTYFVTDSFNDLSRIWVGVVLGIVMTFAAFLFSAVAGYMAGVVGSSNNPISGTAIGTIIVTALLLLVLGVPSQVGMAATILIGSTIAAAAAIAGDNMQDLKAGHLLGGTPRNLQIMQMVGAVAAAFVIPFILMLLHSAYTIGSPKLAAPQANLMASIAQGIFGDGIPWDFFLIGVGVAAAIIVADQVLERRKSSFRMPVLAVAIGIYLPFDLATPIFLGGIVAHLAGRRVHREVAREHPESTPPQRVHHVERRLSRGVLFASGLIAGESLMGILLAGAIVGTGDTAPLAIFQPTAYLAGLVILLYIAFLLGYAVVRRVPGTGES
ncbi:MAG: oligopeptide transporter, OPT family [Euryarchaeota archaeon]|nr:oligopeptide transporter, OPT family [Euryarchaeota archaeon]